jgi:hypothetical protein
MTFDDMLDRVYDDHDLVEWVENASRDSLALRYMELMARYRMKSRELKKMNEIATEYSWERTMRQQERSGGTM